MSIIGIDLGSSLNKIGCFNYYGFGVITNCYRNPATPSGAFLHHKNRWFFGERAIKLSVNNPKRYIYDTKIMLGRKFNDNIIQKMKKNWPFTIKPDKDDNIIISIEVDDETQDFYPYEITGLILKNLVETANVNLPAKVSQISIAIPTECNGIIDELKKAAQYVNLQIIRIVSEPIAASLAYLYKKKDDFTKQRNILVYDLGASSLRVSVIKINNNDYDIITESDEDINSRAIDEKIFKYVKAEMQKQYNDKKNYFEHPKIQLKLHEECEQAKKILSEAETVDIVIENDDDTEDDDENQEPLTFTLTYEKFNEINQDLFKRSMSLLKKVMEKPDIDLKSINDLFLIGGATQIKKIRELLIDTIGIEPCPTVDPRQAIALGACIAQLSIKNILDENIGKVAGNDIFHRKINFFNNLSAFGKFNEPLIISINGKKEIIFTEGMQIPCIVEKKLEFEGECDHFEILQNSDNRKPKIVEFDPIQSPAESIFTVQFQKSSTLQLITTIKAPYARNVTSLISTIKTSKIYELYENDPVIHTNKKKKGDIFLERLDIKEKRNQDDNLHENSQNPETILDGTQASNSNDETSIQNISSEDSNTPTIKLEEGTKPPLKQEESSKQQSKQEDPNKLPSKQEDTNELPSKQEDTNKPPSKQEEIINLLSNLEETDKQPIKLYEEPTKLSANLNNYTKSDQHDPGKPKKGNKLSLQSKDKNERSANANHGGRGKKFNQGAPKPSAPDIHVHRLEFGQDNSNRENFSWKNEVDIVNGNKPVNSPPKPHINYKKKKNII